MNESAEAKPSVEELDTPLQRVVLVGFMGAGKTAVGRQLAEMLGWDFVDSDLVIEASTGCSITELFATEGEAEFRRLERSTVAELLGRTKVVLATGGGWPVLEGTLESIPAGSATVWLQVPVDEVLKRVSADAGRPLLDRPDAQAFATDLLRTRAMRYALADHSVDTTSASVTDVATRVLAMLGPRLTRREPQRDAGDETGSSLSD